MPRTLVHRVLVGALILVIGLSFGLRHARMECAMGAPRESCCCPPSKEPGEHGRRPRPGDPAAIDRADCCAVVDVDGGLAAAPAVGAPSAPEAVVAPVVLALAPVAPRPLAVVAPPAVSEPPARPPRLATQIRLL